MSHLLHAFADELRAIFRDGGILVFCLLVPLGYPLLYTFIYNEEIVQEVPIVVIDDCATAESRSYLRSLDATSEVTIVARCTDMKEAEEKVKHGDAYGIVLIPRDFSRRLVRGEQVSVSAYASLSGMLYYKALLTANTNVSLALNAQVRLQRMEGPLNSRQEELAVHPVNYEEVALFNPQAGFASFLIPAVLMLVLQQTLLLGMGMRCGTTREKHLPLGGGAGEEIMRCMAWLLLYVPVAVYVLCVVPRLFRLPCLERAGDLAFFLFPYLLACVFFARSLGRLMKEREICIPFIVFTSVPLLFISGISWPASAMPEWWKALSYVFPSSPGIRGFVALHNMGARLEDVRPEWFLLWVQSAVWFTVAMVMNRVARKGKKEEEGR
ncbi:MAG: ABC transporter permease [Alloprevotella sp.]